MKKSVLFILLSFVILFSFTFTIVAQTENAPSSIAAASACLNDKIDDCSSLSLEEQIFSALATGKCVNEIQDAMSNDGCWPDSSCDIKLTSQAVLALSQSGINTEESENWLLSKKEIPSELIWYLQIDNTDSETTTPCTTSYEGNSYNFDIREDKTLSANAGTCLLRAQGDYWFRVSPSCYDTEFSITCDDQFTTTKIYQRQGAPTIYVSENSQSSAGGDGAEVTEEFTSACFGQGSCDYEASLWATSILDSIVTSEDSKEEVLSVFPYLTTMKDIPTNLKYLPDAFLYGLTFSAEYKNSLFTEQKTVNDQKYWDQNSGEGRYYDTSVALLPFGSDSPQEKVDSEEWLISVQEESGCWNSGSVRDTAFILYSVFNSFTGSSVAESCEDAGFFCRGSLVCDDAGGDILEGYYCASGVCCSKDITYPTCAEQQGTVCSSNEICQGGSVVDASDLFSGQLCCVSGTCEEVDQGSDASDCDLAGGTCKSSCTSGEEEIFETCDFSGDVCCTEKQGSVGNYWWLWILGLLIILTTIAIIFRDKLRPLWIKIKSKFRKGGSKGSQRPSPRGPPPFGSEVQSQPRPMMPRRSPQARRPTSRRPQKSSSEIDSVLGKLKEMGK